MQTLLIVEDDPVFCRFLIDYFTLQKFRVKSASDGEKALRLLQKEPFDLVLTDMKMPKVSGKDVLRYCAKHTDSVTIVMSAFASIENAVEAMQLGAFHYLIKPFSLRTLEEVLEKASRYFASRKGLPTPKAPHLQKEVLLKSKSPLMQKLFLDVKKCAKTTASVFIQGESGTGKEVISSLIHQESLRSERPFIRVNCAAVAESLLESEFFGHEKGAFTGADKRRLGRFELAHQGTLLLDEVTEMPLHLQSKLLRVLQEQEFERLGGEKSIQVDVRIIATTNRNIQEALDKKLFREDLFYRLHVIPLTIPPLRERKEDLPLLINHFLTHLHRTKREGKTLSKNAFEKLLNYSFPGNIRELKNILERAHALSLGKEISEEEIHLKKHTQPLLSLKHWEKRHILDAMRLLQNNRKKVAKTLGITEKTLRTKLREYALQEPSIEKVPEIFS
ncbi:MAG: sigma-54 dependent transcriptional regulator [Chlamydiota bacterium]